MGHDPANGGRGRRGRLLDELAARILALGRPHPIRVAVDGIDAAGKTMLADRLAGPIEEWGWDVIRASIDGFHQPRAQRYRQGVDSPEGYYHDSFDYPSVRRDLLLPLGPGGSRRYRRAVFDHRTDAPAPAPWESASGNAVLLVDGIFLLRPELDDLWDYRIFLDVDFEVALQRAERRDAGLFGSPAAVRDRYLRRYFPAQRRYLETVRPTERANAVIQNDDPERAGLTVLHRS
ncbi:MAG: uridine kinase [Chloroflexi bacterium]|nr:uridine kinase [Chloroflexota bacterium]